MQNNPCYNIGMDKREEKTIHKIYESFTKVVNTVDYDEITIQDILNESKVSRSTFYAHFKTKDDLLQYISEDIFHHVFSHSLMEESSHDFSKSNVYDFKHLLTHILYHIKDEKELISGVLSSKGNTIFLDELRHNLMALCDAYFNNYPSLNEKTLPLVLRKSVLVESFITIVKYWVTNLFQETPEEVTNYFLACFIKD